jgi:hypothetical protein
MKWEVFSFQFSVFSPFLKMRSTAATRSGGFQPPDIPGHHGGFQPPLLGQVHRPPSGDGGYDAALKTES